MEDFSQQQKVAAVASIGDPLRRSLFEFVTRSGTAVDRDEAAAALGIPRGTAAFHLERLAESGLLETEFRRRSGKSGPGAGRPAKFYRRASTEIVVSVPQRHYDLAAELLSSAIEEAERSGDPIGEALEHVSTELGRRLGTEAGSLEHMLEATGYEPVATDDGGLVLANCPFHRLAQRHTATICAANAALLRGAAQGADEPDRLVRLEPRDGHCCVRVDAPKAERSNG